MQKQKSIKHLLIIRSSAMGDVAMIVHPIIALNKVYPNLKITILTNSFYKPFFEDLPNTTILPLDKKGKHKGIFGLQKLANEIKALGIDAIADFHGVLRTHVLKILFQFSKIPFVQIEKGRAEKKALTRSKNKVFCQLKSSHKRYIEVLHKLGLEVVLEKTHVLPKKALPNSIRQHFENNTKKWIGIAPFAQHKGKVYPLEKMESVIQQLNETHNYQFFLFGGGQKETKLLKQMAYSFTNVTNVAGQFSFSEELALISNLDLMLSMDSGNGHLAAMFAVPILTIWGVTHPYTGFEPFGQVPENNLIPDLKKFPLVPTSIYGNTFPKGYEKAAASISTEVICNNVDLVLNTD